MEKCEQCEKDLTYSEKSLCCSCRARAEQWILFHLVEGIKEIPPLPGWKIKNKGGDKNGTV